MSFFVELSPTAEADEAWFERARPAKEVSKDLVGPAAAITPFSFQCSSPDAAGRHWPSRRSGYVNIRLDADIVRSFRRTGAGWQTRLNDALRDWLREHAS
jgi:uncharacterized protein (DUF4415 family)